MYTFSKDLFVTDDGSGMRFNVQKCPDAEELTEYIEVGGGSVDRKLGPFTIDLHDVAKCPVNKAEAAFHSTFIMNCCTRNKILDLKEFKCPSAQPFPKDFEPNDVLHHKISWENAQQQFLKPDSSTENSDSLTDASLSIEEQPASAITKSTGPRPRSKPKCMYTEKERRDMVAFIVNSKCFYELKGTQVWRRMSLKFPNHTWQSLKNHFFKDILPSINSYKLEPEILAHFKDVSKKKRGSTRAKLDKHSGAIGRPYSAEEDGEILRYVERHSETNCFLGGNKFWQKMKEEGVLKDRTWQSARERYLKCLKKVQEQPRPKSAVVRKQVSDRIRTTAATTKNHDSSTEESDLNDSDARKDIEPERPRPKKKKLFTSATMYDTPERQRVSFSPVSVKTQGLSMLEVLLKNRKTKASTSKGNYRKSAKSNGNSGQNSNENQTETNENQMARSKESNCRGLSNKMSEDDCSNNISPTEEVPHSKKQEICITAAARNTNTESNESSAPTAEVCGNNSSNKHCTNDLSSPSREKSCHLPLTVAAGSPEVENGSSSIVQESVLLSWPSNFRAERFEFAEDSDFCEVRSLSSSITDAEVDLEDQEIPSSRMAKDSVVMNVAASSHSDSDSWSNDGLFWRGECDKPSTRRSLRSASSAIMKPDAQSTQVITPCIQTVEPCTQTDEPKTQSAEPCAQTVQSEMKGTVQVDTSQITVTRAIPNQVGTNAAANKVKINVTSHPLADSNDSFGFLKDLSTSYTHLNNISEEIEQVEVSHQEDHELHGTNDATVDELSFLEKSCLLAHESVVGLSELVDTQDGESSTRTISPSEDVTVQINRKNLKTRDVSVQTNNVLVLPPWIPKSTLEAYEKQLLAIMTNVERVSSSEVQCLNQDAFQDKIHPECDSESFSDGVPSPNYQHVAKP